MRILLPSASATATFSLNNMACVLIAYSQDFTRGAESISDAGMLLNQQEQQQEQQAGVKKRQSANKMT